MNANLKQAEVLSSLADLFLSNSRNNKEVDIDLNLFTFCKEHREQKNILCPACESNLQYCASFEPYCATDTLIPIYFCTECGTIRTPQRYSAQEISIDVQEFTLLNSSLKNHLNFESRNRKLAQNLLNTLNADKSIESILEIGCGPGWLLDEAKKVGIKTVGYDLGTDSVEYGKENLCLDLRNEIFTVNTDVEYFSLLICIMVFEHIQTPDDLASAISLHCKKCNSPALISVPISDEIKNILESLENISENSSLFRYSPGHTCHYTQKGFAKLWQRHGAVSISRLKIKGSWPFLFLINF